MKIKVVGIQWLLLLGGFAVIAPLAAQELKPRLAGIVHLGDVKCALLELPERNRMEFSSPLEEGQPQGQWAVMHIDPARGSVTLSNRQSETILQLAFTNAVLIAKRTPTFRFETASLNQIMEVCQLISGRMVIRPPKLSANGLSLVTGSLATTNEAMRALSDALATQDVILAEMGAKFLTAVPSAQAADMAKFKAPPEALGGPYSIPPLMRFADADVDQVLDFYSALQGRIVLGVQVPQVKITLDSGRSVGSVDAVWALEAVLHLAGVDTLSVGESFVCVAPPEALKRVPPVQAGEANRAKPGQEPVPLRSGEAGAKQVLDLYANLIGRQALPFDRDFMAVRLAVGTRQPVQPAELVTALEAVAALNGLTFERVGNDQVKLVPFAAPKPDP